MAPSPGIFLAALAQRTRQLRFGPLVYLLPLYNPIRLATEIAMLDNLSNGRLEVGVGRGISPFELAYFNVPFLESGLRGDAAAHHARNRVVYKTEGEDGEDRDRTFLGAMESPFESVVHGVSRERRW
jgi:alkanesulfonate monooxygenase SsuD/methylene tetrahydromethanopterin reductase-like flavin-dependent oxidoreductase (luciferase family)